MRTIQENRWQEWCDKLLTLKQEPMSKQQTEMLLSLIMFGKEEDKTRENGLIAELNEKDFGWQVANAHAKKLGLKIDPLALLFVTLNCESPGEIVMYVHALRRVQQKENLERITLNKVCETVFPWGFPVREELHNLWDEQKITDLEERQRFKTDNYIDTVFE